MPDRKDAVIKLDTWVQIPELNASIKVETSRKGDQTKIHWVKLSRIESRRLTKMPKSE